MHPSSYDRMAEFCQDYLRDWKKKPLTIVDLGSCDYNGSYRPIFDHKPWRYIGADLAAGPNVDLVLRSPYTWHELRTGSVDVLVSGQTFEHTEFFWETMLEIARVLKPGGLCCIIAPASGNEHRFPLDCWRIFADGFRAVSRYAGLQVLHAHTHWAEPARYDWESNKWHDSILIARKGPESLREKVRNCWLRRLRRRFYPLPQNDESLIQVFFSGDGIHCEEASVIAGVEQGDWREVLLSLPRGAQAAPLRIDFMRTLPVIDISSVIVRSNSSDIFSAARPDEFASIVVTGDAERVPHPTWLRLRITGLDPQLILPRLEGIADDARLTIRLRLRIAREAAPNS